MAKKFEYKKPQQTTPYPYVSRQINRTLVNSKTQDEIIIQRLFKECNSGNVSTIKNYILKNGLTVNDMIDENNTSVLHVILTNENMSNIDKLKIVNFLESKNALPFSYDSQTLMTPLHLACKMQLDEIAKILIKAGHDVNAKDVNGKTPLFYALTGIGVECPKKKLTNTLVKKFKIKQTSYNKLAQEILLLINKNENLILKLKK